jgi:hypothetical protein
MINNNWSLAMFTARETPKMLMRSVAAVLKAAPPGLTIDILANGNPKLGNALSNAICQHPVLPDGVVLRLWHIPHGDKANAWNQYLHQIWRGQTLTFFVDGYVRPLPDALRLLGNAVMGSDHAHGGSGVPTVGHSAAVLRASMLKNGGIHGNLCCMKGSFISRIKQRGIRLPVGLYRTDSMMGTMLACDLGAAPRGWDIARLLVHSEATWDMDDLVWWRASSTYIYWSRRMRQARGDLEIQAFKDFFAKREGAPELLPATAHEMVMDWVQRCPERAQTTLRRHPLRLWAMRRLARELPPARQDLLPALVWSSGG